MSQHLHHSIQADINARIGAQIQRKANAEFQKNEREANRLAREASREDDANFADNKRRSKGQVMPGERKRGKKTAGGGLKKAPGLLIKKTPYGASVRIEVAGRQYQSALYDQRKGFNGGKGSIAHPVASESMFMRSETYGSRTCGGQKLASGGTSKKKSTAGMVVSEVLRDLENTHHLDQQAILDNPHIVHHGDPAEFREALAGLEGDLKKTSEHYLAGFVFSLPKVSLVKESNADIWPGYRDDCIEFMKRRYPGRPMLIVEHCDEETNFHIHALLLNNPGERLDQWYEPRKAVAQAAAGFTERVIQAKISDGMFSGTSDEQRAAAKTWANGALKHGFLTVQKQDDGTEKKVRVYDSALTKELTAIKKNSFSAAASAMQDDFHAEVASKYGKTRFGPRRMRLSAEEMAAQKAVQSMISQAIDAKRDEILRTAHEIEAVRAVGQKLGKDVARQHGERKIGKRKAKQQRQAAKAESKAHRAEIRALTAEQATLAQSIDTMTAQRDGLAGELKDLSGDITKKTQQLERTRDKIADLLKRGRNAAGQVRQQKAILNALTRDVSELEADRMVKSEALDAMDLDLASKREQLAKTKGELNTTNTELKAVKAEVAQNEEFRVVLVEENEALARKTEETKVSLADALAQRAAAQRERDDIQRTIKTLEFGIQAASVASGMLSCQVTNMKAAKDLLAMDLSQDKASLDRIERQYAQTEASIEAAEQTLQKIRDKSEVLGEALDKLQHTATRIFGTATGPDGEFKGKCEALEKMIDAASAVESTKDIQRDYEAKRANMLRSRDKIAQFGDGARLAAVDRDIKRLDADHQRKLDLVKAAGLDVVEGFVLDFGTRHALREFAQQVCKTAEEGQTSAKELEKAQRQLEKAAGREATLKVYEQAVLTMHQPKIDALKKDVMRITLDQVKNRASGSQLDNRVQSELHQHPTLAGVAPDLKGVLLRHAIDEAKAEMREQAKEQRIQRAHTDETPRAPRPR